MHIPRLNELGDETVKKLEQQSGGSCGLLMLVICPDGTTDAVTNITDPTVSKKLAEHHVKQMQKVIIAQN